MRLPLLATCIAAAALAGCGFDATAEADRLCVTEPLASGQVPGAAGAITLSGEPLPIPLNLQVDVGPAVPDLTKRGVRTDLAAQSLAVSSPEGADFSGVERVSVTLTAPGKPDVVFTYARPAGATAPIRQIVAIPDRRANLVDYLQNGRILTIGSPRFTGRLPSTSWTPQLRTCAAPEVNVDLVDAAGL